MTYKNIEYNDEEPSEIESMRTENASLRAEAAEMREDHMKLVEENHELRQQLAAAQPEPVDVDLRRDAELWRAHQKRKQDLIDRGFLKSCLRSEDAAILQGEQK